MKRACLFVVLVGALARGRLRGLEQRELKLQVRRDQDAVT